MEETVKKLMLAIILIALAAPASARAYDKHALGNIYTQALNVIEAREPFDTIDPKKQSKISDIHVDHGQVIVTIIEEGNSSIATYDMISGRLVPADQSPQIN
jgi:hypothetical protein